MLNTELYDVLINSFVGLITAAVPILTAYAANWLRERTKASAASRLSDATGRAGGAVIDAISASDAPLSEAKEQAIQVAVANVVASMGDTIKKLGGTPDKVEAMVRGEVGKLLAPALAGQKGA